MVLNKLLMLVSIFLIMFLVSSCTPITTEDKNDTILQEELIEEDLIPEEQVKTEEVVEELVELPAKVSCVANIDCGNDLCINGECGKITELYNTNCSSLCSLKSVTLLTSDGFTLNRTPGKGDYTAAGAVEWIINTVPSYCKMDKMIVPFKIITKNLGKKLNESYITIEEGKTSVPIKHPVIKSINFNIKILSVNQTCQ